MQKAHVLWFTGLSGAGKSTLSKAIHEKLRSRGLATVLIDGDRLREGLCKDLGFSLSERTENIRRAAEVCKLFLDSGVISLAAFMSPMESQRSLARDIVGADRFLEIYCKCSFDICAERDVKGIYKKAMSGELKNFVGLDEPYQEPANPWLQIDTGKISIEESVRLIMDLLDEKYASYIKSDV
ncbi:adenylyl-sulfate kinase [Cellvibrio sp.]|uniref:adenylyl-sulfate kinase n=1 Tax=Cellvibrio sp. TaxID=1965322 RepID=UPI0039647ADA